MEHLNLKTCFFLGGAAIMLSVFFAALIIALITKKKGSKLLFGMDNIRWGIKELVKMYSNEPSFFSKKRIHSGIAFIICMHGSMIAMATIVHNIEDFAIWFGLHQPIIFYTMYKIQQEKGIVSNAPKEEVPV